MTSDEDIRRVSDVLRGNYLNDGDVTAEFEKKAAELLGCKHVVSATSGTMALFLSLKASGVLPGDEVIVPDMTWIATANAAHLAGAIPVLVDINPRTLTIDPQAAERAVTPRTTAIMPVHVTGRAADMNAVMIIAQKHGLAVIEDAAEAFLSKYQGKYLGTWGTAGAFSLSPFKIITAGQGGFIATNDDMIYRRLRMLKNQGLPQRGTGGDDIFESIGYNFKFTNIQAAIALAQMQQIPFRMDRIRKTYRLYRENLEPGTVTLFPFNIENDELPLWVDGWTPQRDALLDHLNSKNIDCRKFWHPIHSQKIYRQPDSNYTESMRMAPQSLWLPSAFTMSDDDVKTVCRHINEFFRTHAKTP